MKGKWKGDLVIALVVALLLGFALLSTFVLLQEPGVDNFCYRSSDGTGLIPLPDRELDMTCDPNWAAIAIVTVYYGIAFFFVPLFVVIHGLRWIVHLLVRLNRHLAG